MRHRGLIGIMAVALVLAGCARGGGEHEGRGARQGGGRGEGPPGGAAGGARRAGGMQVPVVATVPVAPRDMAETLELTGTLEAARKVEIAPRVAGSLLEVSVALGDRVRAGQQLARLDDREARERLAAAEASLASARATATQRAVDLRQAELAARRERELFRGEFTARQDLEAAEAGLASARALARLAAAEVDRARAQVGEAREGLARTRLLAPMAGVVGARHLDPGASVTPGTPVLTLVAGGPLKSVVSVSDATLPRLKPGATARIQVDAWPGSVFAARVARVAPVVDPATRTGQVELSVDDARGRLRPGMFARVALVLANRDDVPALPRDAVVNRPTGAGVFVVEGDVARFVPLRAGIAAGGWVEVLGGQPALGAKVVTEGNHLLRDGAKVRLPGQLSGGEGGHAGGGERRRRRGGGDGSP